MATKKTIPIKPLTAWSFSRYSMYKQCPLKVKLTAIDKLKEPSGPAMERGNQIHDLAERYIKGELKSMPPELRLFKDEINMLKKMYKKDPDSMVVEDQWAFSDDWTEAEWFDMIRCWVRIKLDCAHHIDGETLVVTDWKTGKYREESNAEYLEQLELYALSAMLMHPHIEKVRPRLAYLDLGTYYPAPGNDLIYTRADVPKLQKLWAKRVKAMMSDTTFAPRPNNYCRFCHFGQSGLKKGGPGLCQY
jgi:CRISPR/Cas system-associated exonuclease Cas4 (RecB family)